MTRHVAGFFIDKTLSRVLLIEKREQAGRLNAVGGKVEEWETPLDAMRREFREGTGLDVVGWRHTVRLVGPGREFYFFIATGDLTACRACEAEPLHVVAYPLSRPGLMPSLRWVLPLSLDPDIEFPVTVRDRTAEGQRAGPLCEAGGVLP